MRHFLIHKGLINGMTYGKIMQNLFFLLIGVSNLSIRPFGSFADWKDLLHRHPAMQRHPVSGFQAASAFPGTSCTGIVDQGLRLSILTGMLRFESSTPQHVFQASHLHHT